jgi:hypothetical protein
VEAERGGMARLKIGYIWLYFFFFRLLFPTCFCFCKTSGVLSPEWVQHTAERGGLFGMCFCVDFLAFCDLSLLCVLCMSWLTDVKRDQINKLHTIHKTQIYNQ